MRVAIELVLPEIVADQYDRRRLATGFRLDERPAHNRLEPSDIEILARDHHALYRLAAVVTDQEIEGPAVSGHPFKRLRLLLPFSPLQGGPTLPG